jgi:hypothetical protein
MRQALLGWRSRVVLGALVLPLVAAGSWIASGLSTASAEESSRSGVTMPSSTSSSSTSSSSTTSSSTSTTRPVTTTTRPATTTTVAVLDFNLSPNPAPLGSTVTVVGAGCPASSSIALVLNGQTQTTSTADASGSFNFRWTTSTSLSAGTFPLTLTCGGRSVTHEYTISGTVAATSSPGTLPVTGNNTSIRLFVVALSLIVAGSMIVVATRRRTATD